MGAYEIFSAQARKTQKCRNRTQVLLPTPRKQAPHTTVTHRLTHAIATTLPILTGVRDPREQIISWRIAAVAHAGAGAERKRMPQHIIASLVGRASTRAASCTRPWARTASPSSGCGRQVEAERAEAAAPSGCSARRQRRCGRPGGRMPDQRTAPGGLRSWQTAESAATA